MTHSMPRRHFLALGGGLVGASLLSGCNSLSMDPKKEEAGAGAGAGQKGLRSPALEERVNSGSLPALEKRLPLNPKVIQPLEQAGVYGGTLQTVLESTDPSWLWMTVVHDHLVTWDPSYTKIIPNVAEKFEVLAGRQGLRLPLCARGCAGRDGEPFTSDDLDLVVRECSAQQEHHAGHPAQLKVGDKPVGRRRKRRLRGDVHLRHRRTPCSSSRSRSTDRRSGCCPGTTWRSSTRSSTPSSATTGPRPSWTKIDELENVDLPVLSAWMPKNPHGDGGRQVWERNPVLLEGRPRRQPAALHRRGGLHLLLRGGAAAAARRRTATSTSTSGQRSPCPRTGRC